MFCIKCGAENSDDGKFCRKCGTAMYQLKSEPETTDIKPAAVVLSPSPPPSTTTVQPPVASQPVNRVLEQTPPVASTVVEVPAPPNAVSSDNTPPLTDIGIQPNIAGALCYAVGWITGIVFLLIGGKNEFIKFHAWQSIITFGGFSILGIILGIFSAIISFIANLTRMSGLIVVIAIIFNIIIVVFGILFTVLWIILMIKAYQSHLFKLPIAGNLAVRMMKKNPGN